MTTPFKEVKDSSVKLREKILRNGVKFIICFFDENSSDNRLCPISNKQTTEIYRYLIEKLLEDETLGLIFKPKFPKTIYKRISSISNLIQKAKDTGRCVFIDRGEWVSEQFPAEVAQPADLCIGYLLSGTTVLESFLSGTPSVFIDLEGLYSNQIYKWGKGKVVFDDLNELFSVIDDYRRNPQKKQGFGDLSLWVKERPI